jgi:hypothetical protein
VPKLGQPYKPAAEDRTRVESMIATGATCEQVSHRLKIDKKTLYKYFRKEIEESRIDADTSVAGRLYKKCMEGDVTALIWWTKCRMGWHGVESDERSGGSVSVTLQYVDRKIGTSNVIVATAPQQIESNCKNGHAAIEVSYSEKRPQS